MIDLGSDWEQETAAGDTSRNYRRVKPDQRMSTRFKAEMETDRAYELVFLDSAEDVRAFEAQHATVVTGDTGMDITGTCRIDQRRYSYNAETGQTSIEVTLLGAGTKWATSKDTS